MTGAILMASGLVPNTERTVIMNGGARGRAPLASGVALPHETGRRGNQRIGDLDTGQGRVDLRLVPAVVVADVQRPQQPLDRFRVAGMRGRFELRDGVAKVGPIVVEGADHEN